MQMKGLFFLAVSILCFPADSQASYTIKNGKLMDVQKIATLSAQEHYSLTKEALEEKDWAEVIRQSQILMENFPGTIFSLDAYFYLGVALFYQGEYGFSNDNFSFYLKKQTTPKFFEEVFQYKFQIAQKFQKGERKHLLGLSGMPKWLTAEEEALAIYEEVILALPQHDLAVQSLFNKAIILLNQENFKDSLESFHVLLRRFPRHPLALDTYVAITKVYRTQGADEYPNPDFFDLAEINIRKFKLDFPGDAKVTEAELLLGEMTELYAIDLYETAQFYERTKKPAAAMIYYSKIISKYPYTKTAANSQERLSVLEKKQGKKMPALVIPKSKNRVVVDATEELKPEVR